jgi:hypothetical protein
MAQDEPTPATLDAFTDDEDESDEDPREQRSPSIVKRKPIKHPYASFQVGNLVWDHAREWNAYMSPRSEEDNLFRKFNSYGISTKLLGKLQSYEVERVLIPVRDDTTYGHGTVYEFELEAYYPDNAPTFDLERDSGENDTNVCPDKDEDSRHIWIELGSDLFHSST